MLQPFITPPPPVLSSFISPRLFFIPQVENELKELHSVDVAEIHEAITDELKKVQKEEFSAACQKLYNCTKACMYANTAYFELKKGSLPHVSSIFKKIICPKTTGPHGVYTNGAYFE